MKVYTVQQVAKILQVCNDTVKNEIKRNNLKGIKVGTEWRIPEQNLEEYLQVIANNYKTERELRLEKEIESLKNQLEIKTKQLLAINAILLRNGE